jgi:hypothetical protein
MSDVRTEKPKLSRKRVARSKRDVLAGRTPEMQLLRGVRRYVESLGGKILVIGGIEIQEWPSDNIGCFRLAVKWTGRRPPQREATQHSAPEKQEKSDGT